MSTGKRLAKRSIVGTRVCAPYDGLYLTGMIQNVKSPNIDSRETLYSVTFDNNINGKKVTFDFRADDLIGPGFQSISVAKLAKGQRVYITYNGREVSGVVDCHNEYTDEVFLTVDASNGHSLINTHPIQVRRKLDEMRLMESRKSARLQELDTDYSRLACEGQTEQIRHRTSSMSSSLSSSSMSSATTPNGRKRRSSDSSDSSDDVMDDCTAAMILMSLSCSPKSPPVVPFEVSNDSTISGYQSPIPSPGPLSFTSSSAPTWSHLEDHEYLKPPREDVDNNKLIPNGFTHGINGFSSLNGTNGVIKNKQNSLLSSPINIPGISFAHQYAASAPVAIQSPRANNKYMRLNGNSKSGTTLLQSPNKNSPMKRSRGESRKCRKVYGMDNRDSWCTQCKWKKACSRFTD